MKKTLLFLIMLFITQSLFSQKITLHRSVGGSLTYELNNIDSITFLPFVCGDDIIYDEKTYPTVLIGSQCWMKKNLDVGSMIQGNINQVNNSVIEKYCYNNDTANCTIYGGLYQWNEAMQYVVNEGAQGICPDGWHLPTSNEYQVLLNEVGGDGNALKAVGQGQGTNSSGFSILLGGIYDSMWPGFLHINNVSDIWTTTPYEGNINTPYFVNVGPTASVTVARLYPKISGMSIRCLKN